MAARQDSAPEPGRPAPRFTLPDEKGQDVSLGALLGHGPLVLLFVPTPSYGVCAKTACGLRNEYAQMEAAGAHIVGITPRSREEHARLRRDHHLPFSYLSDPGSKVTRRYGVKPWMGLIPGRATIVLDQQGIIRWVERHPWAADRHTQGALAAVARLREETDSEAGPRKAREKGQA